MLGGLILAVVATIVQGPVLIFLVPAAIFFIKGILMLYFSRSERRKEVAKSYS